MSTNANATSDNPFADVLLNPFPADDGNIIYFEDYRGTGSREILASPELINDAEILGTEPEGFAEFLGREATLLVGEMWGARDRRNTQDEDWKSPTMSWHQWIEGGAGNGNAPAWGFSRHPAGKNKAGPCIVLGSSVGGARKAKAMDTMFAMGLDIDSGAKLDDVLADIEEKGLLCIVYTSYNNGTSGLELKRDEVLRKLKITRDPTEGEVKQYLREFDKNRYEEPFIASCAISAQKKQTTEGVKIILDTPPLEKFRLIFPLETPVKLIDLADTQQASLDLWEDKITGLAQNTLGIHFDTSCSDPSRLFYTARHPKGSDDWYAAVVMGTPLKFDDVKPMKKSVYTSNREVNAFTMAADMSGDERPPMALTPSGKSLNDWHTRYKGRFMLADLMETLCPDRVRNVGGEAQGHVHTECPFEHEHSSEGGTATMAVNAIDAQNEYWTWFCHHDSCQGRHKLQHIEEALRQGWFEEDALTEDAGFLLEGDDDVIGELTVDQRKERAKVAADDATQINQDSTQEEIENFCRLQIKAGADLTAKNNLVAQIATQTNYTKSEVKKLWAGVAKETRKVKKVSGCLITEAAPDQSEYARRAIKDANDADPNLFSYMDEVAIVRRGRLRSLDRPGRRHALSKVTKFQKVKDDDLQHIYPPHDVVDDVFSSDLTDVLLPLTGVVDTPFFAHDGTLVTENGYHAGTEIYLDSELALDRVSDAPSDEEVRDSVLLIVEEVLADFPLAGLTRQQIVEQTLTPSGVPAVANTLAMIMLPFARQMIHGPTPGHIINKPSPGTGAGFLVDVCTTIGSGMPAPALAMLPKKEEFPKTLSAALLDGEQTIFFDNINHQMDSPELAAAMTAPVTGYKARILGLSQTALVRIMATWVFTANTLTMSAELLRRCILIDLDRKYPKPGEFVPEGGWRHKDVREWTRNHRGELVHACLTIIQNWVAKGMIKGNENLGSFENWAGIMGGILQAAGVGGLMGNQAELTGLSDGREDAVGDVVQAIADAIHAQDGNRLYIGSKTDKDNSAGRFGLFDILHDMEEVPRLNDWGYREIFNGEDVEVQYHNTRRAGLKFKALAKGTYRVSVSGVDRVASFEMEQDTSLNTNCYRLILS